MRFEFCDTVTTIPIELSACATNYHGLIPAHHILLNYVFLNFSAFRGWSPAFGLYCKFMVWLLELAALARDRFNWRWSFFSCRLVL